MKKLQQPEIDFFERLEKKIAPNQKMAELMAEVLGIGVDAVNRRLRGDVNMTLKEYFTLCEYFETDLHAAGSKREVLFRRGSVHGSPENVGSMFDLILEDMERLSLQKTPAYSLASDDIPFFWHFLDPLVIKFKIHYWNNALTTEGNISRVPFDPGAYERKFSKQISDIRNYWLNVASTEVVGPNPFDSIIKQIIYYKEAGLFVSLDTYERLMDGLMVILNTIEEYCLRAYKSGEAKPKFDLYSSEVAVGNQVILVEAKKYQGCYISTNDFGYLHTDNKHFVAEQREWLQALKRKSTLLHAVSEKQRQPLFDRIRQKLKER